MLLGERPDAPQLRCVVSADVADAAIVPVPDDDDVPSVVELTSAVPQSDVICVHVDEPARGGRRRAGRRGRRGRGRTPR